MWKLIIPGILILISIFIVVFILLKKARKANKELKEKKAELDNLLFSIHKSIAEGYENNGSKEVE